MAPTRGSGLTAFGVTFGVATLVVTELFDDGVDVLGGDTGPLHDIVTAVAATSKTTEARRMIIDLAR